MRYKALAAGTALLGVIVLANWLTSTYGFVPVGFGLMATAGTYAAGMALGLRDLLQDAGGRKAVLVVIVLGAALSYLLAEPFIAVASGAAFLVSELADWAVYTPVKRKAQVGSKRWSAAVAASNAVGAVVDTVVFLGIAFGAAALTVEALAGQLVGKGWATLALLVVVWVARAVSNRRR